MIVTGKPRINFGISNTNDPELISCTDFSDWKILKNSPAVMRIILPGSSNEIIQTWQKERVNVYNSINLGLSCVTECDEQTYQFLPDGIYQFILEGSPTSYNKKRYYLKTDQFRLELNKIYIRANIEYSTKDKALREYLEDVEFNLRSASAFTSDGDFVRAEKCFCEAQKLVRKLQECK